jgi:hypothetical protein
MTTYSLSYYDLKLINVMRYFRRESTGPEYALMAPRIADLMSLDAWNAYMDSIYKDSPLW